MREVDETREQQRCNFTALLNASQTGVLFSGAPAKRGEEQQRSPCVGGRVEEAQLIIYLFSGEMEEHVPGPSLLWPRLLSRGLGVAAIMKPQPRASSVKALPSSEAAQRAQTSEVKDCKCERGASMNPLPGLMCEILLPTRRNQLLSLEQ